MSLILRNRVETAKPLITAAMSVYPYSAGLQAKYVFKTAFDEEICGAIRDGNSLYVPRESAPYADPPNDFRVSHPPVAINCNFKPRYAGTDQAQDLLVAKSVALLRKDISHIFEAQTAYGKTICGAVIACMMGQPTMIVVMKEDLMDQWLEAFKTLGINPALIGKVQQDTCDWQGKMLVVGMAHSLIIPDRYPKEMYRYFGLLELDEIHQMATDSFIRLCQIFPAKLRLGFSATPNRKDGKTKLLHWHVGPTMVRGTVVAMKPKILVRQTGWRIPQRKTLVDKGYVYVPIPHGPGRMMLVNKAQASSQTRNLEIVNFVVQAYKAGRTTLVLSDLKEYHLGKLFQMFTAAGIPGQDIGYYVGGMTKAQLELTKKRRVVLGTYKMCSTGTDVPVWDSLVMATPRADVKQIIGRVMRSADGKKQPVVLDLVDWDSLFQSFHKSRCKQYASVGAEIVRMAA